ncbi:MAG: hypothetical protein JWP61_1931, partial [Friedmanniella sp.]|nr:hypothetical protein [Friedmanniella sp.]
MSVLSLLKAARHPTAAPTSVEAVPTPLTGPGLCTPRGRLVVAIATVGLFVWGQLGPALGWDNLGQVCTTLFLQFGPGAALVLFLQPRRWSVFALVSLVVGPSILIVVGMAAALSGALSFSAAGGLLTVVTLLAVVLAGVRDARGVGDPESPSPTGGSWEDPAPAVRAQPADRALAIRFGPSVLAVVGLALAVGAALA